MGFGLNVSTLGSTVECVMCKTCFTKTMSTVLKMCCSLMCKLRSKWPVVLPMFSEFVQSICTIFCNPWTDKLLAHIYIYIYSEGFTEMEPKIIIGIFSIHSAFVLQRYFWAEGVLLNTRTQQPLYSVHQYRHTFDTCSFMVPSTEFCQK